MLSLENNTQIIKQINKVKDKIVKLKQCKKIYIRFITHTFSLYSRHMKKFKLQINNFQQTLLKIQIYNRKNHQIREFIQIWRKFCIFVQENQNKKIYKYCQLQETKFTQKNDQFLTQMNLYKNEEASYNVQYKKYSQKCQKLNQQINLFKTYENPIKFYNIDLLGDEIKKYDKNYQQCQNSQTILINRLQVLDQKRKLLTQNLKQIKEQFIIQMNQQIQNIKNITILLIKFRQENYNDEQMSISSIHKNTEQEQYNQFLQSTTSIIQSNPNYKLIIDKCLNLKNKRNFQFQQNIKIQKQFIKFINNMQKLINQLDKQYKVMNKQFFKEQKRSFQKDFRQFFGKNTIIIAQLSLKIVQNSYHKFQNISKCLNIQQQKLKKILFLKEKQIKLSIKRIDNVISQFKNNKIQKKNLKDFKNVYQDFMKNIKQIDQAYNNQIQQVYNFINKQYNHCFMPYLYEKYHQNIKIMQNMNLNDQIVQAIKESEEHQILFNQPLKSQLFQNFVSKIQKQQYQGKKKIILKKQYQSRQLIKQRNIGCCGISNSLKLKPISQHKCSIIGYQNNKQRTGILSIFDKGISFLSNSSSFLSQRLILYVSKTQIKGYQQKQDGSVYCISTSMGALTFKTNQCQQIEESLIKNIGNRNQTERVQIKKDTSSSSFPKINSSHILEIPYENTNAIHINEFFAEKQQKILKKLIQKWKTENFFTKQFKKILKKETQKNSVREDFRYEHDINQFLLKQKRSVRNPKAVRNILFFDYDWKICFPQNLMFKSFRHSQIVKVYLQSKKVKINIVEKNHEEQNLYKRKIFYSQIYKLNKNLSNFIVQQCSRQGQVIFQQQKLEEQQQQTLINVNQEKKN